MKHARRERESNSVAQCPQPETSLNRLRFADLFANQLWGADRAAVATVAALLPPLSLPVAAAPLALTLLADFR